MSTWIVIVVFLVALGVSLTASWILVGKLERVGARLGASEALLGLLAALAADTPEISSAISAMVNRQRAVAVGVVIGSNVFNLAALLGLGAIVAGRIAVHRRVVLLTGGVAGWVAIACFATVSGAVPAMAGLLAVLAVLAPYAWLAAVGGRVEGRPSRLAEWLHAAIEEEEAELLPAIHPRPGRPIDAVQGAGTLVIVVAASVMMERAASTLGVRFGVPDLVLGAVALAAATSLPNVVAAVYLARRGRGSAALSTAFNSNGLNVAIGFLVPTLVLGLTPASGQETFVAAAYVALTSLVAAVAFRNRGIRRREGLLIVALYAAFVVVLIAVA